MAVALCYANDGVKVGAECTSDYFGVIKGKRIAVVANQTSVLGKVHLIDTLKGSGFDIVKAFAPEHGLRGKEDAGAVVTSGVDVKTGVKVVSIYGKVKKPTSEMLEDVDVVLFDIQDVGARFYTYISTLHYVMEACAENGKKLIVLDRPNPNDTVDGPVLKDSALRSFVGLDFLPVLHGCTVGELAMMMNGEGWLENGVKCDLAVVKCKGWKHGDAWSLKIKPSPNLPNDQSIRLYPSLCLFEGTKVSVGRGTYKPFTVIGCPKKSCGSYTFTPRPIKGMDAKPMHNGQTCHGLDLRKDTKTRGFSLKYLVYMYEKIDNDSLFWGNSKFFDKLAGTSELRTQIINRVPEAEIRASWQADLDGYRAVRRKYLLY
ncbi:MAG: DUF1343 domain-containing protein [Paludibacteraceae bacterium]|nr:DUF1343 domain-containing protein [Paludibacteraceae bacterium]